MSNEDEIFLKAFTQMIDLLKTINLTIDSLKKSVENIQLSLEGHGSGLTKVNSSINELNKNFESFSNHLNTISIAPGKAFEKKTERLQSTEPIKMPSKNIDLNKADYIRTAQSTTAQHPIFIDLVNNINNSLKFKDAGDVLIMALEQIESSFSFSRVFYEIRRVGNSLIRKGENDFPPNDKTDLIEKLLEWEKRLNE